MKSDFGSNLCGQIALFCRAGLLLASLVLVPSCKPDLSIRCDTSADCFPEEFCNATRQCQLRGAEGDACTSPDECRTDAPICATSNQCQDGDVGDSCTEDADCDGTRCIEDACSHLLPGCQFLGDESLYVHYPLEEASGTKVHTTTSNDLDGTAGAAVVERQVPGVVGRAFRLDSEVSPGSAISLDDSTSWELPDGAIEMWARVEADPRGDRFFSVDGSGCSSDLVLQRKPVGGELLMTTTGDCDVDRVANDPLPIRRWVHIAASWGADGRYAFVDGEIVARNFAYTSGVGGSDSLWYIGGQIAEDGGGDFVGRIDEICIYQSQVDFCPPRQTTCVEGSETIALPFFEDFEGHDLGCLPKPWLNGNPTAGSLDVRREVCANRYLAGVDTANDSDEPQPRLNFEPVTDRLILEVRGRRHEAETSPLRIVTVSPQPIATTLFGIFEHALFWDDAGEAKYGDPAEYGRWYVFRGELDIQAGTFDFYVDGELIADDAQFRNPATDGISSMYIGASEAFDIDDVLIREPFDSETGEACDYDFDCATGVCFEGACEDGD